MGALLVPDSLSVALARGMQCRGVACLALSGLLYVMVCIPNSAAATERRRLAVVPLGKPPAAADVVARMSANEIVPETYAVPVHINAKVHRLITLRFGMDGTVYYKRPDHLALTMNRVPAGFRKLFAELGNAQTWASTYDMTFVDALEDGSREMYRLKGVPKREGDVAQVLLDVSATDFSPHRAQWVCHNGSTIDMTYVNESIGGYELAKRAEGDMVLSGWKIHVILEYGSYVLNESIADSVFSGD
jgi:hypothetical protein